MNRPQGACAAGLTALLTVLVSACASIDAAPPRLQAIKTIGVISAIGNEFTITDAGLTGIGPGVLSIEAWGLDDLVVSRVGALLNRRFQLKPLIYRREAFAAIQRDSPIPLANRLREEPIKRLVREVSPQGLDAYVVVTKATSRYGSRARTLAGVGMLNLHAVFDSYHEIHVLYAITIIDGHDFSVIDKRSAAPLNDTETVRLEGPSRMVDASLQPTANETLPNDRLKAVIVDLLERSLPEILQGLRLVDRT
jgi:hypothetical protein